MFRTFSLRAASLSLATTALVCAAAAGADYREHPEARVFMAEMVEEHDFELEKLQRWFAQAEQKEAILEAIARPAERTRTWAEYRPIFIQRLRVDRGVEFWNEHRDALARAERELGVPAEIIVAIIGVETNYGRTTGSYRVLDALSTLAFDYPPRSAFFRRELKQYLILMREHEQNPLDFKGSYAGAMGLGQFMPSSYRHYAVDFDGDEFADIWNNPVDAIGSVANYFAEHGWRAGEPVVVRARAAEELSPELESEWNKIDPPERTVAYWRERGLTPIFPLAGTLPTQGLHLEGVHGDEYWLALHNFYVITRYNRSHLYAMASYQLSLAIKAAWENSQ
ncbi:lytic murein transglycosylase B [Marinimicrobium sp. C2-29]|uniref:lytic murein transglycosylase B n=1 Tax=Marinimicrobium sp. C2-29 TaxID=3139825 RepID=UPI00313A317D